MLENDKQLGRLFTPEKNNKILDLLNLAGLPTAKPKWVLREYKIRHLNLDNT